MRKFIIVLILGVALAGCKFWEGKTVVVTDAKTGAEYVVDENGATVRGTLPLGDGVSITVSEDTEAE